MGKISCKRLLVLFLLLGLVAASFAYGEDKVEEVGTAAKEKAAEAQGAADSWTDWGKEKINTAPKQSAESIEHAKETASDTASDVTNSGKEKLSDVSSKLQEGSEHAKSTGDHVVGKTHETAQATGDKASEAAGVASGKTKESAQATSDKASEAAGVASGKTKESAQVAGEKSQGAYESTKQILGEHYEAAKEAVNEHLKAASKLASDVGEHVKHLTGAGHEEL